MAPINTLNNGYINGVVSPYLLGLQLHLYLVGVHLIEKSQNSLSLADPQMKVARAGSMASMSVLSEHQVSRPGGLRFKTRLLNCTKNTSEVFLIANEKWRLECDFPLGWQISGPIMLNFQGVMNRASKFYGLKCAECKLFCWWNCLLFGSWDCRTSRTNPYVKILGDAVYKGVYIFGGDSFGITSNKQLIHRLELVLGSSRVPSRELTYPTVGKGKSSSTMPCEKDTEC